jgi:hypothetical protein
MTDGGRIVSIGSNVAERAVFPGWCCWPMLRTPGTLSSTGSCICPPREEYTDGKREEAVQDYASSAATWSRHAKKASSSSGPLVDFLARYDLNRPFGRQGEHGD